MYNDEIVKEVVKDELREIINKVGDSKLRHEIVQDIYEEYAIAFVEGDYIS